MLKNKFAVLLAERKLKANKVAAATGIAESTLSYVSDVGESKRDVRLSTLIKICVYLDCKLSELIEYVPETTE